MIHFWLPDCPPASEVLQWDPDGEPSRYASGVGHNVIELYRRLAETGVDVTLGSNLPHNTRLVVLYAVSIEALQPRKDALDVVRRARGRYVLIRGDAPVTFRLPVRPVLDFMPIHAAVKSRHQRWLPPLPQRGLKPRRPDRFGHIRSLAFKGNPENVPPDMRAESWTAELASRGISWWLDAPRRTDGSDQRWHDFSDVDAIVCMRNPAKRRDITRKPATRLINAWRAGCIPLADREAGYQELASDEHDVFYVDGVASCLDVLDRLNGNRRLLERVEARIMRRRADFAPEDVLTRWQVALLESAAARECSGWRSWTRTGMAAAAQARQAVRRA